MSSRALEDVPPSAKLVFKVLEYNGALTQKEIVRRSMLSQRTVRDALARLREIDVVAERVYIPDARQSLYELTVAPPVRPDGPAPTAVECESSD